MTTTNSPHSPLMDRVKEARAVDFWTGIYVLELLIFAVLLVVGGIYNGSFVCFITAGVYFFFICGTMLSGMMAALANTDEGAALVKRITGSGSTGGTKSE